MDVRQAAIQIAEIQSRLSEAHTFRGYRSLTVGLTGLVALITAVVQTVILPDPLRTPRSWLALWLTVAGACLAVVGLELALRCRRSGSRWFVRLTVSAVTHFLPCVVAGGALTATLASVAPESLWMLPGLWAILFSLGVFASYQFLPPEVAWVGVYYLTAGVVCLIFARGQAAFCPESMGLTFGIGQLLSAGILRRRLEDGNAGDAYDA